MTTILCVIGRTNSGKDSLINAVAEKYGIPVICSYTDRPKRPTEAEGIQHHFLSEKAMTRLIKTEEIIAYTQIEDPKTRKKGYRYCTTTDQFKKIDADKCFYAIDPKGLKYLKENFSDQYKLVVISVLADESIRRERSLKRGDLGFDDRVANENQQFQNFESDLNNYDICVVNNTSFGAAYDSLVLQLKRMSLI